MKLKVKTCCCCLEVDTGVMILGILVWTALLSEVKDFNPVRAVITLATGSLFLLMVFRDSAKHREWFYYSYIVNSICSVLFAYQSFKKKLEESQAVDKTCQEMQKKGEFKEMLIKDMDECHEVVGGYYEKGARMGVIILSLLFFYFCIVVRTHWKNYGRRSNFRQQIDEPVEQV